MITYTNEGVLRYGYGISLVMLRNFGIEKVNGR